MTVGLCMDIVEIGLAMHLQYYKTMHPYGQTELQPEPLRGGGGGSAPIITPSNLMAVLRLSCLSQQGTIIGFAGFTANKTLGGLVKAFFAYAPITTTNHVKGSFKLITDHYKLIEVCKTANHDHALLVNQSLLAKIKTLYH